LAGGAGVGLAVARAAGAGVLRGAGAGSPPQPARNTRPASATRCPIARIMRPKPPSAHYRICLKAAARRRLVRVLAALPPLVQRGSERQTFHDG
jgi:hypothetical protein